MAEAEDTKYAIRVLRRLDDGTIGVFYVDAETGETLDSLDGYEVVSAGNLEGGNEVDDEVTDTPSEDDKETTKGGSRGGGGGDGYGLLSAQAEAMPWKQTVLGKILGADQSKAIEKKVTSAGGVIQPAQVTKAPEVRAQAKNVQGPLDMGAGLATSLPDELKYGDISNLSNMSDLVVASGPANDFERNYDSNDKTINEGGLYQAPKSAPVDLSYQKEGSRTTRQGDVEEKILGAASVAAQNTLGPGAYAVLNSGGQGSERDPAMKNQPGGWTGSTAHNDGHAGDFAFFSADGTPATQEQMASILADASRMGITGTGYASDYMGSNVAHMDIGRNRSWGAKRPDGKYNPIEMTKEQKALMDKAKDDYIRMGQVVPTERPANITTPTLEEDGKEEQTVAQQINRGVTDPVLNDDDLTIAGTAASYGLSRAPNENELEDLARTFAGELSGDTLRGLVQNDPAALAELASVVSTYENRLQSGAQDVLRGSQYNSNLADKSKVTNENYGLFGQVLKDQIGSFYQGGLSGLGNTDATHYHADYVNPSWSTEMANVSQYDSPHLFGTIPDEYQTDVGFLPRVQEAGANRVNYQYDNNRQLDNSSILDSAPSFSGLSSYNADVAQANEFSGLGGSSSSSSRSSSNRSNYSSNEPGDAGYGGGGSFDYSGSSGSGSNSGNSYSPASGSNSPGGSGSNSITSSPPSIDTSGVSGGVSDRDAAQNREDTFSNWSGWI